MTLATEHVRYLRGLAHALSPIVLIGNKGISDNLLDELKQALDRHELVKLRVLAETREERDQLVLAVLKHAGAELVQRVGHTATLYRQHPTKPKIALPGTRPKSLGTSARPSVRSAGPGSQRGDGAPAAARAGRDGNVPFRRDSGEARPATRPARPVGAPRFERDADARPYRRDTGASSARARPASGLRFTRGAAATPYSRERGERSPTARPGAASGFKRDSATEPFRRDTRAKRSRAVPGAPQRFARDKAAKPYRRGGEASAGVVRESIGAPRRERGALKFSAPRRQRAGSNPYSAWSGAGKGADAAAPGSRREPSSTGERLPRFGPGGDRGSRPPRPR